MSLYYDVNSAPALKNLNMTIEPGMKVGIVGRFVAIISSRFFPATSASGPGWEMDGNENDFCVVRRDFREILFRKVGTESISGA